MTARLKKVQCHVIHSTMTVHPALVHLVILYYLTSMNTHVHITSSKS